MAGPSDLFEKEREELLDRIKTISLSHDEMHRLEWENKKRCEEVSELQKASGNIM